MAVSKLPLSLTTPGQPSTSCSIKARSSWFIALLLLIGVIEDGCLLQGYRKSGRRALFRGRGLGLYRRVVSALTRALPRCRVLHCRLEPQPAIRGSTMRYRLIMLVGSSSGAGKSTLSEF